MVVIQARMGSTRLPGKVLADVAGRPLIMHVVQRAARIVGISDILVAIPDLPEDDLLQNALRQADVRVARGSATDVLDRYITAIQADDPDGVVRITADCPLLSPVVSTAVVRAFRTGTCDYASNTLERSYPRGLDTEVVSTKALRTAAAEANEQPEREHVTPFVWRRPQRFQLCSVKRGTNLSHMRWTVDTPADLQFVRTVYEEIGDAEFDEAEVVQLLQAQPAIADINANVPQKDVGP
ncbi:MAG: cytidylyltransferase domain-containing protein [Candidatus Limnocylindria bacterium]